MGMEENVIAAERLTKVFGGRLVAVDHVSFSVKRGETFGFLGPNGAGKSTTIKMLTTILRPTEGRARILGSDVSREPSRVKNSIGIMPQEYTADEDLTGYQNLMLYASVYGVPREIAKKRALELPDVVQLMSHKDREVHTYSGGMRRRLELACSLINNPSVLFLDEPTLGLDVQTRAAIWKYVRNLKGELGMTLFLTTHYLEEADALCDRVAIIDNGRILVIGSPSDLKSRIGEDIIALSIQDSVDISEVIQKVPRVKEVIKDENSYVIKVEDGEGTVTDVIDAVRAEGHRITRLSLTRPTLDEVYMSYTGRSMREEEGSKAALIRDRETMRKASGGGP